MSADELTQGRILLNHTSVVSAKLAFLLQGFACFLDWTLAAHQVYSIDELRSELRDLTKPAHKSRCNKSTSVCSLLEKQVTKSTRLDIKAYDRSPPHCPCTYCAPPPPARHAPPPPHTRTATRPHRHTPTPPHIAIASTGDGRTQHGDGKVHMHTHTRARAQTRTKHAHKVLWYTLKIYT